MGDPIKTKIFIIAYKYIIYYGFLISYVYFNLIGSPNKKGGRGIATIKIFACDAADHLAGRSIKRFKDGGAQSVCHSAFADDGISVWLLETERCMYHNGCIGGGAECALADLSGDSCSFVYIQSDVKNRGDGTDQKNAGGRFKRSESTGLNYRMGVR